MSFDSKFGLGAGKNQDLLQPSKTNPFSLPGAEDADDESGGLDFSSIFQGEISQRIQDMNSPFHKTAQPILDALKTGAPIATDTIKTMLTDLLAVAEALLEQLQNLELDPTQAQKKVEKLIEFKKTLNGIFDMGAAHRNPHAVSKLADLYKKMPPQTDQMVSTLFFQYTKIESFPAGTSSQDGHREEIAYFHFQMMTVLDEKGKDGDEGSEKISVLHVQLMSYSSIQESLDIVDELPEEIIADLEEEALDDVSTTASDDAEMSDISDTDRVTP
tara:strand:+ start:999 stop:1817 length:819 start_codon:yes stop_codon:yes gene_type:complete